MTNDELVGFVERMESEKGKFFAEIQSLGVDDLIEVGQRISPHTDFCRPVYMRALELDAQCLDALIGLACAYWLDGEDLLARAMLERAKKIAPNAPSVLQWSGNLDGNLGVHKTDR